MADQAIDLPSMSYTNAILHEPGIEAIAVLNMKLIAPVIFERVT